MILHISDDNIFLDEAINQFEAIIPNKSIYLVSTSNPKHIKNLSKIVCAEPKSTKYQNYINRLNTFEAVIIHALTYDKAKIINKSPKNVKFVWMLWGADGFYLDQFKNRWYSDQTKLILDSIQQDIIRRDLLHFLKNSKIYKFYHFIRKGRYSSNVEKLKAMQKISYIAPVIKNDYHFLKKELGLKANFLPFLYGCIETLLPGYKLNDPPGIKGELNGNILIGNSADPSNNHIDIFQLIERENIKGKFICLLSYGNLNYRDKIIKKGKQILGASFYPIIDFLPLKQYQRLLESCKVVIMNHYRQQAMGGIISALWLGAKVYMNKNSPAYSYFREIGINILKIDNIKKNNLFNPLRKKEIENNKKVLMKYYSKEKMLEKARVFIETISK